MHCGCPLPGNTIGQRLKRLTSILTSQSASARSDPSLCPPSHHATVYNGTHPSDHNCVRVPMIQQGKKGQKDDVTFSDARAKEMKARRERDAKAVQQGKMDELQYKRGEGHDAAFLVPVPFYVPVAPIGWGIGMGVGVVDYGGVGACAVVSVMNGFLVFGTLMLLFLMN